jgi:hypothetical protein
MLSIVTSDNTLLWQSDNPDVIFNCRRVSLYIDTNVIHMPFVKGYSPSDSKIILFRKIADYIEYINQQCNKAVTDYISVPFNSFLGEILNDDILFDQCLASSRYDETKLRSHLSFLNDSVKIKKSWIIGTYLRYVDKLVNVQNDNELTTIKLEFQLEFDECNRI